MPRAVRALPQAGVSPRPVLPRPEWLDSSSGQPRSQTLPCPWAPRGNGRERPEEVWNRLGGAPRQAGSALPAWVLQRTLGLLLPPALGAGPSRSALWRAAGTAPWWPAGGCSTSSPCEAAGPWGWGHRLPVSASQSEAAGWAGLVGCFSSALMQKGIRRQEFGRPGPPIGVQFGAGFAFSALVSSLVKWS